ncbi:helix-turn-helix domain-containing protein [Coraliomargarita algicola]|uniref:Helix-turn-helix domain-containing protein n=1 Tax=Coraliomargarita algicola TaxID=3092156 RepID=A0ABZ0RPN4_9BACT|nr:helix-turn-helix domain-containing protein [Coraliomargarita sp. J2-16]WPJ97073.1 helix-turn-helix domain-containing protein [Coraliomargarita sp. J2-16]
MKTGKDIPAHIYSQTSESIRQAFGKPFQSLGPQFPFLLLRFEQTDSDSQAEYAHRHDYYELLYIEEGQGQHFIDFESYPVQANTFYFLSKDQVHFWELTRPLRGYALLFPEDFLSFPLSDVVRSHDSGFFHKVAQAPYLNLDDTSARDITALLKGMEEEFYDEHAQSLTALRAYFHILLTKLGRLHAAIHTDSDNSHHSSIVKQFEQLVAQHYRTEHSVKDYAKRLGVSSSHLRDTVKAVTGQAPGHIIRQRLALEAKRRLAHEDATIAEIGYRLNFEDASYFARFFKRETGLSPQAFRQQFLEKYHVSD